MKPETTTPNEEKHSINWGWITWPCVALVLYVLSSGPVVRIGHNGRPYGTMFNSFLKIYGPLEWAYWETPFHKPLGMYFHLWAPNRFDTNGDIAP